MSKVLIVYGSTTGNTEALAEILGRLIQKLGMRLPSSTPLTPVHPAFAMDGI